MQVNQHTRRASLLVVVVVQVWLGIAQGSLTQQLANTDWFRRPLAPGVEWRYYKFDSLFGSPQSISIIEADLNVAGVGIRFPFLNTSLQRTSDMIPGQFPGAAAGVNGTFFSWSGGHRTFLRTNGTNRLPGEPWDGNWGYNAGFVYDRTTRAHDVIRVPNEGSTGSRATDWATLSSTWTDVMVNGPFLVQNGNITNWAMPGGSHCNRHPRTCVGYKAGNRVILMVADGRLAEAAGLTCVEMAQLMQALGCTHAQSLDGGGSSTMYGRGEPHNGVLNFPSGNSQYDQGGERSVGNAIAVLGNARIPLAYDARLEAFSYPSNISPGSRKWVTVRVKNIGSSTWTSDRVSLTTSRPGLHASRFYDNVNWINSHTAWRLPAGVVVPPDGVYTFQFPVMGPIDSKPVQTLVDHFQLTLDGTSRFGMGDHEMQVRMINTLSAGSFMIESRAGGQNVNWYSELSDFADVAVDSQAGGETPGIGMRYASTYRSIAGAKAALYYPQFAADGRYRVYVAWGPANLRRNPITYNVNHAAGRSTFNLNQSVTSNEWLQLGTTEFLFQAGVPAQGVEMTNEQIDISGNMYAGPALFEFVGAASSVADWSLY